MRIRLVPFLVMLVCISIGTSTEGFAAKRRMTVHQFPMRTGSRWVYAVHDSVTQHIDTVHVRIAGTARLPDGRRAGVWEYRSTASIDTQYVVRSGDTIAFYRARTPESVVAVLIFPILSGRTWTVIPPGTATVQRTLTATVPAGKFPHSFEVKTRPAVRNFIGGTTYTLAPRVGIVRIHFSSVDTINNQRESTLWRLLSCAIAQ